MKTVIKPVYYCDHCNKKYLSRYHAEKHEQRCNWNPDNKRVCFGCKFLEKKTKSIWAEYGDMWGNEQERQVEVFWCGRVESWLYPPKVEHKGNAFDMGHYSNEPMKRECDMFEEHKIEWV